MKLKTFSASVILAVASATVAAQEAAPIGLVLAPAGNGTLATTFERSVTGLFVDTFTFAPPMVTGTLSVNLVPANNSVSFFAALLNDVGFSFLPESGATSFAFSSTVSSSVPLSLQVFGYAGNVDTLNDAAGTYAGTFAVSTVAAIPEPEIWALTLAGLALVGAGARHARVRDLGAPSRAPRCPQGPGATG